MKLLRIVAVVAATWTGSAAAQDLPRWERLAANVTIIRDDWGIAHVYGRSDADAVFGMIYAQAEDDFHRVETNYLTALGRLAEAQGPGNLDSVIFQDLRMRLFIDPDSLRAMYARSPGWLRTLLDAWADGLNFYLHRHPEVRPRVITRFEPWMALAFSEGSIGGDIESIRLDSLRDFYAPGGVSDGGPAGAAAPPPPPPPEPRGSNGIAIAPSRTGNGRTLLLINPHTSFFFRSELQMVSDEGLNAYGAVTWGQFFVYQGFNDRAGWMHTSSGVDNIDEYQETVFQQDGRWRYRYGAANRAVTAATITIPYRAGSGMASRTFTVYRTHHGPVVRRLAGQPARWVTVRLMHDPINALIQSYSRTKARDLRSFRRTMERHTNSSNNTVFASADGDIAYFHSNFIPRRDTSFDWRGPVDGSDPRTEWRGVLSFEESPNVINPATGWLYNANDAPWWAAGPDSPRRDDFPRYVDSGGETARGRHAVRVLRHDREWTIDSLIAAAYDSYLPWFEATIPTLLHAWDQAAPEDTLKAGLREPIEMLRGWDFRWSAASVPTSLAVFWGTEIVRRDSAAARRARLSVEAYVASHATPGELLASLAAATGALTAGFGTWRTPWGNINRFQRLTGDIVQPFDDSGPSIPVAFTSAQWGSLASFGARPYPGTRKWYGTSGNSFVAVVEFGDSVRARAVTAGGESGDPRSRHFNDQAQRYAAGNLRDVYFYRSQLAGHTEREYRPGN
jgi:acyl-homoserine lactone acylase PvdQ